MGETTSITNYILYTINNELADSIKYLGRIHMRQPSIEQYLVANCLSIIDEFNILYKDCENKELKKEADEKFNEMDLTVRVGYPFKQTVHYTAGEGGKARKELKINHDLYVEQKDFKIEIKYLKNWKSSSDTWAASKKWSEFQQDFDWLMDEIDADNQGKVAFVIGWFNCVDSFSQLIQLGKGRGAHPIVNESRRCYFPFLKREKEPTRTTDLKYNYPLAYKELDVIPISDRSKEYHCMFLGNEDDKFHFAIYY